MAEPPKLLAENISDIHNFLDIEKQGGGREAAQAFSTQNFGQLNFPSDIEGNVGYWAMFSPFEYSRANRAAVAQQGNQSQILKGHIVLPLPGNLSTGYGANYSQESLGISGMAVAATADFVNQTVNKLNSGENRQNTGKSVAENFKALLNAGEKNTAGALASLGLAVDDFFGSGISIGSGYQRNPHLAVLFEGHGFRQHTFTYKFTPKNQDESVALFNIIRVFKAAMHASFAQPFQNHLFKYPDEWDITFNHPQFKIGPSVLLDFQVNYHGEGVPSYFWDKKPVTTTLHLVFQETSIVTREDVLERGR